MSHPIRKKLRFAVFVTCSLATTVAAASTYWGTLDQEYARAMGPGGKPDELYYYVQDHYLLVDPVGDLALTYTIKQSGLTCFKYWKDYSDHLREAQDAAESSKPNDPTIHDVTQWLKAVAEPLPSPSPQLSVEQIEALDVSEHEKELLTAQLENSHLALMGREDPFKVNAMVKMFTEIMVEERENGITPKVGTVHQWSPEFLQKHRKEFAITTSMSKILVSLVGGMSSKYLVTGQERTLARYVLALPLSSLTIDQAFRKSYELNDGDVYLTLLTLENVLSRYWLNPQREDLPLAHRLSKITNFYGNARDENRFGQWYHLFGIMLYAYATDAWRSMFVADVERTGAFVLQLGQTDHGEDFTNIEGARIGVRLKDAVVAQNYLTQEPDPSLLKKSSYLRFEDFRDRINVVADTEIDTAVEPIAIAVTSEVPLTGCQVDVMVSDGEGQSLYSKFTYSKVDFHPGHAVRFPSFHRNKRDPRVFISDCEESPTRTWVGLGT